MQFGQARIALGMTKAEVLQQIRLSQSQYRPLIDHESYEIFVQTPSPKEVESDRWTLICPARASPTVGGGSGIMLLVDFTDDVVVRIRELPWLAG